MKSRRLLIFACVLGVACGAVAGPMGGSSNITFGQQRRAALEASNLGDKHYEAGEMKKAAEAYAEALRTYSDLEAKHPNLQTREIRYRIKLCQQQLARIKKKSGVEPFGGDGSTRARQVLPGVAIVESRNTAEKEPDEDSSLLDALDPSRRSESFEPRSVDTRSATPAATPALRAVSTPTVRVPSTTTLSQRVMILLNGGGLEQAGALLSREMERDPDDPQIRLLMGMVQCRAGAYDDAVMILESLAEEEPTKAVKLMLSGAYAGAGMRQESRQLLVTLAGQYPDCSEVYMNLANLCFTDSPPALDHARIFYGKALRLGATPDTVLASKIGM